MKIIVVCQGQKRTWYSTSVDTAPGFSIGFQSSCSGQAHKCL